MAYVYRHIRLDKNVPFYIGIGTDEKYYRATAKRGRSKRWQNVVSQTEYDAEIIIEGLSIEEAMEKEKEFILLYGREDLQTGSLINVTEGGEIYGFEKGRPTWNAGKTGIPAWNKGQKTPIEVVEKMRKARIGKKINRKVGISEEAKIKISNSLKGREAWNKNKHMPDEFKMKCAEVQPKKAIIQYDLQGNKISEYISIMQASRDLNMSSGGICDVLKGKYKTLRGYIFKYKEQ